MADMVLLIICLFTGQLIRTSYIKTLKTLTTHLAFKILYITIALLVFLAHLAPVILIMIDWVICPVEVFGVCYLFRVEKSPNNTHEIPVFVLRQEATVTQEIDAQPNPAQFLNGSQVSNNLMQFETYAKFVILFFAVSSFLSYALIQCALITTYIRKRGPQEDQEAHQEQYEPLEPFCVENIDVTNHSTRLPFKESMYFNLLLLINLALWIACVLLFTLEHYSRSYYKSKLSITEEAIGFGLYMYSLLCSIASCFLFSKLAFGVTHRCQLLVQSLDNCNVADLQRLDDDFTKTSQATLNGFELWFTVHWICYTMSSFLSVALVLEAVSSVILAALPHPQATPGNSAIDFSPIELVILAMFTVSHCILFLYPCFKAAAVTVCREKVIKKVNTSRCQRMTAQEKQIFIQYLKNKKFGFRISFFCARLRFSYNIAYISIFIGLLGMVVKISGLF